MTSIAPGTKLHFFIETLRQAIGDVYSASLASDCSVGLQPDGSSASLDTSALCFELLFSGGLQGRLTVQMQNSHAQLLAEQLTKPTSSPAAIDQKPKDALEALWQKVASRVASELHARFGEAKVEVHTCEPQVESGATTFVLLVSGLDANASVPLSFSVSTSLAAALTDSSSKDAVVSERSGEQSPTTGKNPNLDLFLGANLNLTLRFGQRVLSLREVLGLTSGSVIELDREVHEPADLLLGDKLIARGEVVIVDGNYGIRVTEVADTSQRLKTI